MFKVYIGLCLVATALSAVIGPTDLPLQGVYRPPTLSGPIAPALPPTGPQVLPSPLPHTGFGAVSTRPVQPRPVVPLPRPGGYGSNGGFGNGPVIHEPVVPAQYEFSYQVDDPESGNNFGHQENRNDQDTTGQYYVLMADGRLQRVNYEVHGDSGYLADVTYEGEARPQPTGPVRPVGPGPVRPTAPRPSYGVPLQG